MQSVSSYFHFFFLYFQFFWIIFFFALKEKKKEENLIKINHQKIIIRYVFFHFWIFLIQQLTLIASDLGPTGWRGEHLNKEN